LFNPETVARHQKDGIKYVTTSDYESLLERYREAIDCLLGMVGSNTDAMYVLNKAGLTKTKLMQMQVKE
jgi:hypothetical protein